jgi:TonB-dependent starch-binding outer membrane protein SusC
MRARGIRSGFRAGICVAAAVALAGCGAATPAGVSQGPTPEEEQVNLGYVTEPEATSTASSSRVSASDIRDSNAVHMVDLLRRLPGVVVSGGATGGHSVRVRGASSFLGSNEPLVVVNGVPIRAATFSDAVEGLNPRDVRRIDVVTDPGSLAMYGSRGANGVIVITMKNAR